MLCSTLARLAFGVMFVAIGTTSCVAAGVEPAVAANRRIDGCRVHFADSIALASERPGLIAEVVAPGTIVAAGDDVARLRDGVTLATRATLAHEATNDIEVRFARKSAELAQLKYDRAIGANQSRAGTVSDLELHEIELAAEKARLQLEQANHTLAVAKLKLAEIDAQLETLHIRAPNRLFVRAVHKRPGEVVQQGEVIADVVDVGRLVVDGFAPLEVAQHLRPGRSIGLQVGDGAGAIRLPGVLTFVDAEIEPVSQTIRVAAEVANVGGRLRGGIEGSLLIE